MFSNFSQSKKLPRGIRIAFSVSTSALRFLPAYDSVTVLGGVLI
jgi:hypothetical protein